MTHEQVLAWMDSHESDVTVCDCCGDGEGWYGTPGEHHRIGYDERYKCSIWDSGTVECG